jgi:photosystem II stability/assembly factor-like uncharacterized protein
VAATVVQLQVATSSDGGVTEADVISSNLGPSHQHPYYGFVVFWADERGGPADGSGITHYLIVTNTNSLNPTGHVWHSTDDTLQAWTDVGFPPDYPGQFWDVIRVRATGTILLASGTSAHLVVWRNVGGMWSASTVPTVPTNSLVAIAEADDGSLWVATDQGALLKSTNDGASWAVAQQFAGAGECLKYFTAMGTSGPGLPAFFWGARNRTGGVSLYVSHDNGQTWTPATGLPATDSLAGGSRHSFAARLSNGTYLVGMGTGLFHSTDPTGLVYQQETLPTGFSGIEALANGTQFAWIVFDNDGKGPYLYKRNTDASYHANLTGLLTLLDTAKDVGAYYITSVSTTPYEFFTQYARIKNIRSDFIRKQNGTYLVSVDLTSGISGIARSADGGMTWTFAALPNNAPPMRGLVECNDGTVLVPTDGSAGPGLVFRSTDDGQTFQVSLTPAGVITAQVGLKYFAGSNTLFAYVAQLTGTASFGTAVYESTDQGQTWTQVFTQ